MNWEKVEVDEVDCISSGCVAKKKTYEVSLGKEHKGKTKIICIYNEYKLMQCISRPCFTDIFK